MGKEAVLRPGCRGFRVLKGLWIAVGGNVFYKPLRGCPFWLAALAPTP